MMKKVQGNNILDLGRNVGVESSGENRIGGLLCRNAESWEMSRAVDGQGDGVGEVAEESRTGDGLGNGRLG